MTMDQRVLIYFLVGLFALILARHVNKQGRKNYRLPPLVPGIPIFGNALQVPPTQQGEWAKNLAAKYGEMYELISVSTHDRANPSVPGLLSNLEEAHGSF